MHLSKGEFTQFSLRGRLKLLNEFGIQITENEIGDIIIKIYHLYDFYVEVFCIKKLVTKIEPLVYYGLLKYYL
jgi:hypothetical protein